MAQDSFMPKAASFTPNGGIEGEGAEFRWLLNASAP